MKMKRAPRLNKAEQEELAAVIPVGKFHFGSAVEILSEYSITPDQVRTVLTNSPFIRKIRNRNGWYEKAEYPFEPIADTSKQCEDCSPDKCAERLFRLGWKLEQPVITHQAYKPK